MKKNIFNIIILLILFLISACEERERGVPQGIWLSEDPHIILYINPAYQLPSGRAYFGFYNNDDEEVKICLLETNAPREDRFSLCEVTNIQNNRISFNPDLFAGDWCIINDEMHYSLLPRWVEQTGYETIIFTRTEEYEPIYPTLWFRN